MSEPQNENKSTPETAPYLAKRIGRLLDHFEASEDEDDKLMSQELAFILSGVMLKDAEIDRLKREAQKLEDYLQGILT